MHLKLIVARRGRLNNARRVLVTGNTSKLLRCNFRSRYSHQATGELPETRGQALQANATAGPAFWTVLSSSTRELLRNRPAANEFPGRKITPGRVPLVLILVTPAHIALLDDSDSVVPSIIKQSFRPIQISQQFDVLVAVVDRIPLPENPLLSEDDLNKFRTPSSDRNLDGYEGISVATMDSDLAAPNLWSKPSEVLEKITMNIHQRSALRFQFADADRGSVEIQVPVANTIFHNGRPSTLFAQRWIGVSASNNRIKLACKKKTTLENQTLDMTSSVGQYKVRSKTGISTCLRRITPPRVVAAATGNILRQLISAEGVSQPASQELEMIINEEIQNGQLERSQVEVWALILPQSTAMVDSQPQPGVNLQSDIARGARLLKVLSGGGGWGEKQGLLALDPDAEPDVEALHMKGQRDCTFMQDKGEIFTNIVNHGDNVTFLVNDLSSLRPKIDRANGLDLPPGSWKFKLQEKLLEFGCLPSKIDEIPLENETAQMSCFAPPSILIKKYFGMLSEHSMSFKSKPSRSPITSPVALGDGLTARGPESTQFTTTKLDAPYTLVSMSCKAELIGDLQQNEFTHPDKRFQASEEAFDEHNSELLPTDVGQGNISTTSQEDAFPKAAPEVAFEEAKGLETASTVQDEDDNDAMQQTDKFRLAALEAAFQAGKLKSRAEAITAERQLDTPVNGDITSKIRYAVPKERNEVRSKIHSVPSAESRSGKDIIRKFLSGESGKGVANALRVASRQQGAMSHSEEDIYKKMLSRGVSTAEALKYIKEHAEDRKTDGRLFISDVAAKVARRQLRTSPKAESKTRRHGDGEDDSRDKARRAFRLAKYPSISELGKVLELRERSPIMSRDQAMNLHREYHLVPDDAPSEDPGNN